MLAGGCSKMHAVLAVWKQLNDVGTSLYMDSHHDASSLLIVSIALATKLSGAARMQDGKCIIKIIGIPLPSNVKSSAFIKLLV